MSRLFPYVLISTLLLSACMPRAADLSTATVTLPTTTPSPQPIATNTPVPPPAAEIARQWLSQQLGLSPEHVTLQSVETTDWPDACLGVQLAERACAEVITPGYKIILRVEEALYEIHTDMSGSRLLLAAAPAVEVKQPLIVWSEWRGDDCVTLQMNLEEAAHGLCGSILLKSYFPNGIPSEVVAYFNDKYAPFEAETPAGKVIFGGHGPITATPWEQRSLAEWARLLYEQATSGRTGAAWGLALAWQWEGGVAGFCDAVTIYRSGEALVSSCKGDVAGQVKHIRLTSNQLQQIYTWVDEFAGLEYEHTDPATADAMTIRLVLAGTGQRQMDEYERQAMSNLLLEILAQARTTPSPQEMQLARQALLAYFEALNAGRYQEAAALYGGDYQVLRDMNLSLDPNDYPALFRNACTINGFVCDLKVKNFVWETQLSVTDFRFTLELQNPDGSLFSLGPCCGASPDEFPPLTQFDFWVKKVDGKFLVLDLPIYVP